MGKLRLRVGNLGVSHLETMLEMVKQSRGYEGGKGDSKQRKTGLHLVALIFSISR